MLRAILGTVLGCAAAMAVVFAAEMIGSTVFFLEPAGPASTKSLVEELPLAAKLLVVGGWWLGTAFGAWIAVAVGRARWPALAVGVAMAGAVVANVILLAHPLWMQIAGVLGPLAIGGLLWRSRRGA